jgi:hypothetical protein
MTAYQGSVHSRQRFFLCLNIHTSCGAYSASYQIGNEVMGTLSPGVKQTGRETDHSSPCSAEFRMYEAVEAVRAFPL